MENNSLALKTDNIKNKIYLIRDLQVMLDEDLADLYKVKTKRLNEQVKRNIERFPREFMFQLTDSEFDFLKSQFEISKNKLLQNEKFFFLSFP